MWPIAKQPMLETANVLRNERNDGGDAVGRCDDVGVAFSIVVDLIFELWYRIGVVVVGLARQMIEPGRGHERMMNDFECFQCRSC
jgi:hypothetical protein